MDSPTFLQKIGFSVLSVTSILLIGFVAIIIEQASK